MGQVVTDAAARRLLAATIGAGFVAGAMLVAQAWLLSLTVDAVFLRGQTLAAVAPLLGWLLLCLLLRSAALYVETVTGQRAANRVKQAWRRRVIDHWRRLGPVELRRVPAGELVNAAGEGIEALDAYVSHFLPARMLAALLPTFILLVVFLLDPWTTLVLLFAAPMLILMVTLIGGRAKALTAQRFFELSWMSAFFLDMLQGLVTLKLFGRSREQAETIRQISSHYGKTTLAVLATAFQSSLVMEWAATAATALVALEVSYRLMAGALPFAPALAVLLLTPEFFLPLRTFALRYHAGAAGKAALAHLAALLATPTALAGESAPAVMVDSKVATAPAVGPVTGAPPPAIRFEEVSYAYAGGTRPALQACSFTLAAGRCTALVGASGAGKSTIVNLLLRFIAAQQGQILVDGATLAGFDADAWRCQVAWVGQHPHLFHGSVLDNLRLARPAATLDEVVAAAQAAAAHTFITALPEGYATPLGEQGARLSGGQRQRLALARAFLKRAPLLILDEATAHLDAAHARQVRDALAQLMHGRTVLIVAHRLDLAQVVDQVIVLEAGRVVEQGAPADLLAQASRFRTLAARAAEGQ